MTTVLTILGTGIRFGIGCGQWNASVVVPVWGLIAAIILFSLRYRISRKRR